VGENQLIDVCVGRTCCRSWPAVTSLKCVYRLWLMIVHAHLPRQCCMLVSFRWWYTSSSLSLHRLSISNVTSAGYDDCFAQTLLQGVFSCGALCRPTGAVPSIVAISVQV